MAERAKGSTAGASLPRSRTFGTATATARQFSWLWGRESILRLALSLVLAIALWLYITAKQNPAVLDYNQPLAVSATGITPGLTITNNLGAVHVRIRVDNPSQLVTPSNFRTFVNLFGLGVGMHPRVPVQVQADAGIHIVTISPATVPVTVDRDIKKSVPIRPDFLNPPPEGYELLPARIEPSTLSVEGPATLVSQVTSASVSLSLTGVTSTLQEAAKPLLLNAQRQGITGTNLLFNPPEVIVTVPVRARSSYKTLPLLVPIRGHPKPGYGVTGVTVTPAEITAKGAPNLLARISSASTSPVWVSGRSGGRLTTRATVVLPRGVTADTRRVSVSLQLSPVDVSSSIEVGISPQGVATGLVARTKPAFVLVTVIGPASRLANAARSMHAIVDMTGYGSGIYQLAPRIIAPPGLSVGDTYPPLVSITLEPAPAG